LLNSTTSATYTNLQIPLSKGIWASAMVEQLAVCTNKERCYQSHEAFEATA